MPSSQFTTRLSAFLCHSSKDKPAVRQLNRKLLADGIDPWLDEEKLLPGQDWEAEIRRAVHSSHVVLICLSHESIAKEGFINKEIKIVFDVADRKPENTIFIIPVLLEDCPIPERFSRKQCVKYFGEDSENGYSRLMRSLRARAGELGIDIAIQPEQTKSRKARSGKNRRSKKDEVGLGEGDDEPTYSPAEICSLFGVARTTLFRWEEQADIPKAIRGEGTGSRSYTREHLRRIAELLRRKIKQEINSRYDVDQEYPQPELAEKLYRLEFICNTLGLVRDGSASDGLRMLSHMARQRALSKETLDLLIKTAADLPAGNLVRRKILELLRKQEDLIAAISDK